MTGCQLDALDRHIRFLNLFETPILWLIYIRNLDYYLYITLSGGEILFIRKFQIAWCSKKDFKHEIDTAFKSFKIFSTGTANLIQGKSQAIPLTTISESKKQFSGVYVEGELYILLAWGYLSNYESEFLTFQEISKVLHPENQIPILLF